MRITEKFWRIYFCFYSKDKVRCTILVITSFSVKLSIKPLRGVSHSPGKLLGGFFFHWLDCIWLWHYLIKQQTPPISNSMLLCSSLPSSCNIYTAHSRQEGVSFSYKKTFRFTMPNDAQCCQPSLMILLFSMVTGDQFPLREQAQIKRIRHEKGRSKKKKNNLTLEGPAVSSHMTKLESLYVTSCLR